MPKLTIDIPEVVALRLEALASASGKMVNDIACESFDSYTGSFKSRRAILKARREAAKTNGGGYSLADLGWLDGYAGQSVDELLAFEGTDGLHNILFALEQAIQKKLETEGKLKMTGVERIVLSVRALEREVNNGGYDQFFLNSSRVHAPAIVRDLLRIGCTEMADITRRALDAEHLDGEARTRALERCDVEFYERAQLSNPLFVYVKKHQDGIKI